MGSEMCIRDRSVGCRPPWSWSARKYPRLGRGVLLCASVSSASRSRSVLALSLAPPPLSLCPGSLSLVGEVATSVEDYGIPSFSSCDLEVEVGVEEVVRSGSSSSSRSGDSC